MDQPKPNPKIEKIRRELQRRSLDQVKVFNPTDEDSVVVWDKFRHVIPSGKEKVLYRYIAMKYIREMTDKIIYQEEEEKVKENNDKRMKQGHPPLTPQEREQFALQYGLHTGNEEKRKEIFKKLYRGVASEYGTEMPEESRTEAARKDTRSFEERMMEEVELEVEPAFDNRPKITDQIELNSAKDKLIKKASKNGKKSKKNS